MSSDELQYFTMPTCRRFGSPEFRFVARFNVASSPAFPALKLRAIIVPILKLAIQMDIIPLEGDCEVGGRENCFGGTSPGCHDAKSTNYAALGVVDLFFIGRGLF